MHVPAVAIIAMLALVPASVGGQEVERRAFQEGGPINLVRTGKDAHDQLLSADRTSNSMSFSTREMYDFTLYVDAEEARRTFESFRGQDLSALLKAEKLQPALINADFQKLIVLAFSYERTSREVREFLSTELQKSLSRRAPELGKFFEAFRDDFKRGDEVVIRIAADKISVTAHGKQGPEIESRNLARALVKFHATNRSLADAGPLLK